ncbi:MAG: DHA2 family efflux MFS transporter permease subunit [Gemmatimonadales bacterium]
MATMVLALPGRRIQTREAIYNARYLIAFAVTLASVLELVDTSIVNVAIPHMMGNLGATLDEIAWVSTGYIVANVIVLPLTGWLSVRFGRRNYYTGSIILFTTASFFCGNAHTLESLVFWRVVQGIGGGALISTAQAILFDVFPLAERGTAMAIFGMGVMVGPTLGPTLGGWITDNFDWPWIFYINIPLGILAAILTWRHVPEPEHVSEQADHVDWLGLAFLIMGIGALQVLLERGESQGWFDSREITAEAVLAAFGLVAFVWHELTTEHPIVDLRILKNRQLAAGVTFGLALGFALYASVFALPILLQNLLGYSAWDTGKVILPGALASAVTMAFVGRVAFKVDARLMISIGVGLVFWSMWLHYRLTLQIGLGDLFWPMILRGVGLGFIFVPLTNATVADLHPRQFAQGTGLFNLSRQLGGSFGIAIAATLVTRFTIQAQTALTPHVNAYDPAVASWLAATTRKFQTLGSGVDHAALQAHAVLARLIGAQASMIAFERVFLTMGITFVCALPLLLLFRTGKVTGGSGAAH